MSSRSKHMERSHRGHFNRIPQFQQFAPREVINQSFNRDNRSFGQSIALIFSLMRRRFGR